MTVQFTKNSYLGWLNAAITATCWALRCPTLLPPYHGSLPSPRDGIQAAYFAWSQLEQTTIVDSSKFLPLYLELTDKAEGMTSGNEFIGEFINLFYLIPGFSELIHPTFKISTFHGPCKCYPTQEGLEEINSKVQKLSLLHLEPSTRSIASSLTEFATQTQFRSCPKCGQKIQESIKRGLIEAPSIIAISIQRDKDNDLLTISEYGREHDVKVLGTVETNYTLIATIQKLSKNHYVANLKSPKGSIIQVDDNKKPVIVTQEEIGKSEIFLFRKINKAIKGGKRPVEQNEDSDTSSSHSSNASSSHSPKKIMKMQQVSLEDHFGYTYRKGLIHIFNDLDLMIK